MDEWDYWIGKIAGKSQNYRHLEVFLAGKLIYCLGGWSLNPPDHISEQIYSIMFVDLYVEVREREVKKGEISIEFHLHIYLYLLFSLYL
jgi:hypothetical protein